MTPWLAHELRGRQLDVECLDARHARAALKMQINKNDRNDAEGLAQIMRTGWYRPVHVKSFEAHRARSLFGARSQLVGMTTRLSNHIRGVLKTFGLLPGAVRGLPFDRRVDVLLDDQPDLAPIVRPMLTAWRRLREQKWGRPLSYDNRDGFQDYSDWMWRQAQKPDLVLVDGRFRVCCFLTALKYADEGTEILFDDYGSRRFYHIVEEFVRPSDACGRQRLFIVPRKSAIDQDELDANIRAFRYVFD